MFSRVLSQRTSYEEDCQCLGLQQSPPIAEALVEDPCTAWAAVDAAPNGALFPLRLMLRVIFVSVLASSVASLATTQAGSLFYDEGPPSEKSKKCPLLIYLTLLAPSGGEKSASSDSTIGNWNVCLDQSQWSLSQTTQVPVHSLAQLAFNTSPWFFKECVGPPGVSFKSFPIREWHAVSELVPPRESYVTSIAEVDAGR